jgi:hypothetical protein
MPLQDHFRPPLYPQRSWVSFHSRWANSIADELHHVLPRRYFAEVHIHLGWQVEANAAGFSNDLEVHVRDQADDAEPVAVVGLVRPRNKDHNGSRAFAAKCLAYLQRRVGLIVVDIVTSRNCNLHNEMMRMLNCGNACQMPSDDLLYAAAYRPVRRQEANQIDVWPNPLTIGQSLPVVPLALRGASAVPLDLEATYNDACQRSRL